MNEYLLGQTVRVKTATPFSVDGVATDPTTITLRIEDPAGAESVYTYGAAQVQRAGVGDYYKEITVTLAGLWAQRWEGTGAVAAVDESYFFVLPSEFSV